MVENLKGPAVIGHCKEAHVWGAQDMGVGDRRGATVVLLYPEESWFQFGD